MALEAVVIVQVVIDELGGLSYKQSPIQNAGWNDGYQRAACGFLIWSAMTCHRFGFPCVLSGEKDSFFNPK